MSKKELDRYFSLFIRKRDSDENGYGKCISCGKIIHWKDGDCGHYINRKHNSTRYDEMNCNLQCRSCNRFDEGNSVGYRAGLIAKYGLKRVEILEIKKYNKCYLGKYEIELLLKEYKDKLKKVSEKPN